MARVQGCLRQDFLGPEGTRRRNPTAGYHIPTPDYPSLAPPAPLAPASVSAAPWPSRFAGPEQDCALGDQTIGGTDMPNQRNTKGNAAISVNTKTSRRAQRTSRATRSDGQRACCVDLLCGPTVWTYLAVELEATGTACSRIMIFCQILRLSDVVRFSISSTP
ncbi:MAG: hypothetical protein ACI89X_004431 [Planctomycetota bacterium]|jgi:hypothetical protein